MFDFKFNIGERVKLKATGYAGEVVGRKYDESKDYNGDIITVIIYTVQHSKYSKQTYSEDDITFDEHFTKEFEDHLLHNTIDGNLILKNYSNIEPWQKQRERHEDDN